MTGLFQELTWRGLVHQVTSDALADLLDHDATTAYIGFDPSADSLQLGNLVQVLNLRRLQEHGHRPVALAGGATGMVGDPSGKSDERTLLDADTLAGNVAAIREQLGRFIDLSERADGTGAVLVDNHDWLGQVRLLDFLRDVGKQFTVNQMVAKESVRSRLEGREQGISYTEFSYMLLQASDFLHLFDALGCRVQIGASDQWGNITAGIELVRRARGVEVFGLTTPLITDGQGRKLGKTAGGQTLWLDRRRTTPYALYQHLVRSGDAEVGSYLRSLTFLSREEVEALDAATAEAPERREAQRRLADEVVRIVHGDDDATRARHASEVLFSEDIASLDEALLLEVFAEAPLSDRPRTDLDGEGVLVVDVLADAGLFPSKGQARKALSAGGGASVNNRKVEDADRRLTRADLLHDRYVVLRKGKRDFHLLRFA